MDESDRYVVLTHEFAPFRGGVATYAAELTQAGRAKGLNVEVWAPGEAGESKEGVVRLGPGRRLDPVNMMGMAMTLRRSASKLRGATVVLVSVGAQMAWMLAERIGRLPAKAVVIVWHGSEILKFRRRFWWRRWVNELIERPVRVVCVSKAIEALVRESFAGPKLDEVVLAPGAPTSSIVSARSERGLEKDAAVGHVTILTLARIHRRKGQLDTARALAALPQEVRSRVVYWVAGKGDEEYWDEIQAVLDDGRIRWSRFGEVTDAYATELYEACDIYVMSSRSLPDSVEGLGLTYLDAGMFAKPVVAYDSGGVREAVLHGETGLVVPEGDIRSLGDSIRLLVEDAEARQRMGRAGKEHASRFSWHRTAERVFG